MDFIMFLWILIGSMQIDKNLSEIYNNSHYGFGRSGSKQNEEATFTLSDPIRKPVDLMLLHCFSVVTFPSMIFKSCTQKSETMYDLIFFRFAKFCPKNRLNTLL